MNFFKKMGVAVGTLLIAVAAAVTIGKVRESGYTQANPSSIQRIMKDYEDEEGMAGVKKICEQYVIDNADVIDNEATDRIVNNIANMALRDDGVIAVATEKFAEGAVKAPEDLKKTAERLWGKLGLGDDEGAIMVLDVESRESFTYDPGGKYFGDMSEAELLSITAEIKDGFAAVDKGDAGGIGEGISGAYDVIARIISDPASFQNMENAYVVEEDDGSGINIVEKTVDGGMTIISGITKTVTGITRTVFRIVGTILGGIPVFLIVIAGIVFIVVRSGKNKKGQGADRTSQTSGQGGRPGADGRAGRWSASARKGRNLSQSGNIDTSRISTQGSQYRWSANKNPYSGLNNGKADNGGFVFPSDFESGDSGDQHEVRKTQ